MLRARRFFDVMAGYYSVRSYNIGCFTGMSFFALYGDCSPEVTSISPWKYYRLHMDLYFNGQIMPCSELHLEFVISLCIFISDDFGSGCGSADYSSYKRLILFNIYVRFCLVCFHSCGRLDFILSFDYIRNLILFSLFPYHFI